MTDITFLIDKHMSIKELCKLKDILMLLKVDVDSRVGLTLQTVKAFSENG